MGDLAKRALPFSGAFGLVGGAGAFGYAILQSSSVDSNAAKVGLLGLAGGAVFGQVAGMMYIAVKESMNNAVPATAVGVAVGIPAGMGYSIYKGQTDVKTLMTRAGIGMVMGGATGAAYDIVKKWS